mmetsp:Transcript_65470/g.142787  ORF Transcript_65470/g.142787 Transcript_65470/m.142787 type:complete len:238 (+) Transcript_65470:417-1130(+)
MAWRPSVRQATLEHFNGGCGGAGAAFGGTTRGTPRQGCKGPLERCLVGLGAVVCLRGRSSGLGPGGGLGLPLRGSGCNRGSILGGGLGLPRRGSASNRGSVCIGTRGEKKPEALMIFGTTSTCTLTMRSGDGEPLRICGGVGDERLPMPLLSWPWTGRRGGHLALLAPASSSVLTECRLRALLVPGTISRLPAAVLTMLQPWGVKPREAKMSLRGTFGDETGSFGAAFLKRKCGNGM